MNTNLAFELPTPDISAWRAGNTGVEGVWSFDSGRPGRHVLISALVHGNEICGAWALKGLLEAGLRPQQGQLTLAFCNLAAFDRFEPTDHDAARFVDEDLNRQWLAERMDAANSNHSDHSHHSQERRRAAALRPFVAQADWLLDLHSMHEPCAALTLTGLLAHNIALAQQLRGTEYIVVDAGHQDGVRMRDFGRFALGATSTSTSTSATEVARQAADNGCRALLVECGFHGALRSRAVAQDQCLRFLQAAASFESGALAQQLPGWRLADAAPAWVLEVSGPVVARSAAFRFTEPFQGLEVIAKAGTVIGFNDAEPVRTPYDDCVLVMPSSRQARAGVSVVRFARRRR